TRTANSVRSARGANRVRSGNCPSCQWLRLAPLASFGADGFVRREWLRSAPMALFGANGFVRRGGFVWRTWLRSAREDGVHCTPYVDFPDRHWLRSAWLA